MSWAPILHISGKFRFQMPGYNNAPANQPVPFDPAKPVAEVQQLCECDPAKYFEFDFFNTSVQQVTYLDGTSATAGDPVVGMPVTLSAFMVDVSPSAICAQIFPVQFGVGTLFQGVMAKAIQSDLRLSIRPLGFTDQTTAAHFETSVRIDGITSPQGSRLGAEMASAQQLTLYFHLNHYTRIDNSDDPEGAHLTGDVYGYIRPFAPVRNVNGTRVANRRIVAHPRLRQSPDIEGIYLLNGPGGTNNPVTRNSDIDGSYDFSGSDRMLALRYLDFVPFLDRLYTTPKVAGYVVSAVLPNGLSKGIGQFEGTHKEMIRTGGLATFGIPGEIGDDWTLSVEVIREDNSLAFLMLESEWDLLLESERGLVLGSSETATINARVYRRNQTVPGVTVEASTQPSNRRSPVVVQFKDAQYKTDADGMIVARISAIDLNATGGVVDPVTNASQTALPLDRYYGNYLYLRIPNTLRRTTPPIEEAEIAVRVLHKLDATTIVQPSFAADVRPLFSYYLRYFPWLHVRHNGTGYERFLDLENLESVQDFSDEILSRLGLPVTHRHRMPRSRDFPIGGLEVVAKWIASGMLP